MSCVDYEKDDHAAAVLAAHDKFFESIGQALDALNHKAAMPSGIEVEDYAYFVEDVLTAFNNRANEEL